MSRSVSQSHLIKRSLRRNSEFRFSKRGGDIRSQSKASQKAVEEEQGPTPHKSLLDFLLEKQARKGKGFSVLPLSGSTTGAASSPVDADVVLTSPPLTAARLFDDPEYILTGTRNITYTPPPSGGPPPSDRLWSDHNRSDLLLAGSHPTTTTSPPPPTFVPRKPKFRKILEQYLANNWLEVMVVLEADEPFTGQLVEARNSYGYEDMVWDHIFAPSVSVDSQNCAQIDYKLFHKLVSCPPAEKIRLQSYL